MKVTRRHTGIAALLAAGGLLGAGIAHWQALHAQADWQADLGAELFDGRVPMVARIDGHEVPMVASAVACANCHAHAPGAGEAVSARTPYPATASAASSDAPGGAPIGPALDGPSLTNPRERRGGPPSRFALASFCRLLRTGEDPAGVLLPKVMPRYEIDDATCGVLWRHVTRPPA